MKSEHGVHAVNENFPFCECGCKTPHNMWSVSSRIRLLLVLWLWRQHCPTTYKTSNMLPSAQDRNEHQMKYVLTFNLITFTRKWYIVFFTAFWRAKYAEFQFETFQRQFISYNVYLNWTVQCVREEFAT